MRTIIIGEVGNNHESEKDILDSIDFLRSHGCLIKFQAHQGEFEHLKDYVISKDLMKKIAAEDVFYSVFSTEMVDWLEKNIRPRYYKLASRSFGEVEILECVIKTGAQIIQSVPLEIRGNTFFTRGSGIKYLHCVSAYPTPCAHLRRLNDARFSGFSDHTTSTFVPAIAVAKGAKIIEKHFKIREMQTPDSGHSLLPDKWDEMLKNIEDAEYHCGL